MRKILVIVGLICLCGCAEFSENCHYTGVVDLSIDKSNLSPETKKMKAVFYCDGNPTLIFDLHGDTVLSSINAGKNNILLINDVSEVSFDNLNNKESAQISLKTLTKGKKVYVNSAPLIFTDKKNIDVLPFDTVKVRFIPILSEKKINFKFQINGDVNVSSLSAELSGIQTKYSLSSMSAISSEAILPFDGIMSKENNFSKSIFTLGINKKTGIKKLLSIKLNMSDQMNLNQNIDLTDKLDNSDGAVIDCTIIISINKTQLYTTIQDWTTHDWGAINF
jgi:hypothetical protein